MCVCVCEGAEKVWVWVAAEGACAFMVHDRKGLLAQIFLCIDLHMYGAGELGRASAIGWLNVSACHRGTPLSGPCCKCRLLHLFTAAVLARLSEGFSAAVGGPVAAGGQGGPAGSAFLQRKPADLLVGQVQQLQAQYRKLLLESTT